MKKIVSLVIIAAFWCGIAIASEWYSGGKLHKSTIGEFVAATPENQLATCADWTASTTDRALLDKMGIDGIKDGAEALRLCILEGTKDAKVENQRTTDFAVMCMALLKEHYPWMLTSK